MSLRRFLFVLASVFALAFASCDTIRPIASKPPLEKVDLAQPFTAAWKNSMVPLVKYSVTLPAGEYRPLLEDDQFYYYQAPSRVIYKDLNSSLLEGGIRLAHGSPIPRGWFCVGEDGTVFSGDFKTPLPVR
ncbi:MAG: hypothetical protein ACAI37_12660 [Chthoniobacter sp.]